METTSKRKSGTTDLTVGKPLFQILRFALPLVLGTLFQQLYSFADTVIVGRCLGTDALGAVGTPPTPSTSSSWALCRVPAWALASR